jgi:hypothetical protein
MSVIPAYLEPKRYQLKLVNLSEESSFPGPAFHHYSEAFETLQKLNEGRKIADNLDRYFIHDLEKDELLSW